MHGWAEQMVGGTYPIRILKKLIIVIKQVEFLNEIVCLCFTSLQQRGHLETAHPFTVPCEGREALKIHRSNRESNPGPPRDSPLRYRCAM